MQHQMDRLNRYDQETGLYIGDIEEAISVEHLFMSLRDYGQMQYIKLHRYPFIGQSKHFAFVYYTTKDEAQKAREAMNYKKLLKKPIRVTTLATYDKEANLFFFGFNKEAQLQDVDKFFSNWGPVVSVQFSYDENKQSRGYGWVQFAKKEDSEKALTEFKEKGELIFNDQKINIKQFMKKGQGDRQDKRCNLYVKNFWHSLENLQTDEASILNQEQQMRESLNQVFSQFGKIVSVFVKIDVSRKSPYGFVSFENNEEAKKAIQAFGPQGSNRDPLNTGKSIYVSWAQTKKDRIRAREGNINDRYIFLQNLKQDVNEEILRDVFKEFGEIQNVKLDKINIQFFPVSRIGYVVFRHAQDAQKLVRTFREKERVMALFDNIPILTFLFMPTYLQRQQNKKQRFNRSPMPIRQPPPFMQGPLPPMGMPPGFMMPQPPINQIPGQPPFILQQMQVNMYFPPNQYPQKRERSNSNQVIEQIQKINQRRNKGQNVHPNPQPKPQHHTQKQYEYVQVAYDKKPDLLELLKNLDDFKKLEDSKQRQRLGQMLLARIKQRMSHFPEKDQNQIVGMLIDEQFEIDEIIEVLKHEETFEERMKEAEEALREGGDGEEQ